MNKPDSQIKMELAVIEAFTQMAVSSLSPDSFVELGALIKKLKHARGLGE